MKEISKIKLINLEGTPKERGYIHGKTLKKEIVEMLERYKYSLKSNLHEDPNLLIEKLLSNSNFLSTVKKRAPNLLEEIKGIAEGAGLDFKEIFALQTAAHDEGWWFFQRSISSKNCSSLGCFSEKSQPTIVAQNLDMPNFFEGMEILFRIKYDDSPLEVYVLSHAGFLGEFGMSNQPIGVCCNSMSSILNNSLNGLPFTFIIRRILEQNSLENAINFIRDTQHASAQNYIIGDSKQARCLECSANKVVEYEPYNNTRRLFHTNHPLKNDDFIVPQLQSTQISTSYDRFNYLKFRLQDPSKKVSVDTFKNILRSHYGPVCVHHNNQPNSGYTYSSAIYELSSSPTLNITIGPPCLTEYKQFKF